MNLHRVRALMRKEWLEMKDNKTVAFLTLGMPPLLAMIGVSTVSTMAVAADGEGAEEILPPLLPDGLGLLEPAIALQAHMQDEVLVFQLLNPLIIPVTIASFSIVSEKRLRSLEPMLASPLTTAELLVAKLTMASAPALVATALAYAMCIAGFFLLNDAEAALQAVRPTWLVGFAVLTPACCVGSAIFALWAGSRFNDPRVIQSLGAVAIMPLGMAAFASYLNWFSLDLTVMSGTAATLVVSCALGLRAVVALFDREAVLTRWT